MKIRLMTLLLFLCCAAQGQEDWIYPPSAPISTEAKAALQRAAEIGSFRFEEALEIYLRLANENPGTALGGDSLCGAMYTQILMSDKAAVQSTVQRLITEYPGSRYEVYARRYQLDQQLGRAPANERLVAYSNFFQSLGAPRLEAIAGGQNLESAVQQALALPFEVRVELAKAYYICVTLPDQLSQRVLLARFGQQAFGTVMGADMDFGYTAQSLLAEPSGKQRLIASKTSPPRVTVLSPVSNSTVGTQPDIKLRVTSGDYRFAQLSLATLSIKIDGAQQKNRALINTVIDETLSEGVDFQVTTIALTPTLTPGVHTVEIVADTGPYPTPENTTTLTWSFTVSNNPPPPPPPPGGNQTLQASKDALVYEKNPHSNEGANPKLTLEKITGKASRNLLGFNLSGINAATVSKATLVLTIDPSDQVTGWGNGDTVNVKPVTVAWQEGNGKSYGLSSSQQSAGSGAGTTWFSPTDDNISNNSSNSVTQWNGGATYATTGAAPPLTVQNHQTGELRFNVTADVRGGAVQGWLLRKDAENKGSKVTFYSKEGAAAAGNPDRAPRLILEFGSTTTQAPAKSWLAIVLNLMEQGYLQLQAYRTPPALSWLGLTIN